MWYYWFLSSEHSLTHSVRDGRLTNTYLKDNSESIYSFDSPDLYGGFKINKKQLIDIAEFCGFEPSVGEVLAQEFLELFAVGVESNLVEKKAYHKQILTVFHALIELRKNNELFAFKYDLCRRNGIYFRLGFVDSNDFFGAKFISRKEVSLIYFYVNHIEMLDVSRVKKIVLHEFEHAFDYFIHLFRCEQDSIKEPEDHFANPWYPLNKEGRDAFRWLLDVGFQRVQQFHMLLKKTTLTEPEERFLSLAKQAVANHMPSFHYMKIVIDDKHLLANLAFIEQVNAGEKNACIPHAFKNGIEGRFFLKRINILKPNKELAAYGVYAPPIHDGSEAFVADIFILDELLEGDDDNKQLCERFVRIMSELPYEAIRFFFPELAQHACQDAQLALRCELSVFNCIIADPQFNNINNFSNDNKKEVVTTKLPILRSPVSLAGERHEQLVKDIKYIISDKVEKYLPFLNAIDQKNYSKALRCACTSNDANVLALIKTLLKYKNTLNVDINEQVGKDNFAAIHYAAAKSTKEVYDLLVSEGANPYLRANSGITAVQYAEERFMNNQKRLVL